MFILPSSWLKLVEPGVEQTPFAMYEETVTTSTLQEELTFVIQTEQQPVESSLNSEPSTILQNELSQKEKRYNAHFRRATALKQSRRASRMERYNKVTTLHAQGGNLAGIGRQLGLDRRTVKRFVEAEGYPELNGHKTSGFSKLKPFEQYLQQRWYGGQKTVKVLFAEIKEKGYTSGSTTVYDYVVRDLKKLSKDELREKVEKDQSKKAVGEKVENLTPKEQRS